VKPSEDNLNSKQLIAWYETPKFAVSTFFSLDQCYAWAPYRLVFTIEEVDVFGIVRPTTAYLHGLVDYSLLQQYQ